MTSAPLTTAISDPCRTFPKFVSLQSVSGGLLLLPRGHTWKNGQLKTSLLVNFGFDHDGWVATAYLGTDILEYGIGNSQASAVMDLLVSLAEYRESLEKRQDRIGQLGQEELRYLQTLVRVNLT